MGLLRGGLQTLYTSRPRVKGPCDPAKLTAVFYPPSQN